MAAACARAFPTILFWLPFVTAFYINVTGDASVLDEVVPFLEQAALEPEQHENYMQPEVSAGNGLDLRTLCACSRSQSAVGKHGLPLMGAGDWNDGMNRVGHHGKGESVWLGWFLYTTLAALRRTSIHANRSMRGNRYRKHLENLQEGARRKGLGRRLVPPRLFRRRHAAGFGAQ